MGVLGQQHAEVADRIEAYFEAFFWDPNSLVYGGIDVFTNRPIARELLTRTTVPRRAAQVDPWAYWAYEDSVQNTGIYLDGQVLKYEVTGDPACLEKAKRAWLTLRNIYSASQVYGNGSFLRPYGGFEEMHRFVEPLGTDQASPTLCGLYRYMKHADESARAEITDLLLQSITWYERQEFKYFYYKCFIHEWNTTYQHAASYYLPAIAFAAKTTGEQCWARHLREKTALFGHDGFNVFNSLYWGSDLPVLKDILGEEFDQVFTRELLDDANHRCEEALAAYNEPGMVKRYFPESVRPGFTPYMADWFDPDAGMGFPYFGSVHQGRSRPRMEGHFLCGMAAIGYPGAHERAVEILSLRTRVPEDFTDFLVEDYDLLPEEVHLFARTVCAILPEAWRDYWLLRHNER